MHSALLVIDCQVDFCEGGSLAVPGGNRVCNNIGSRLDYWKHLYDLIVFSKDWHNLRDDNGGHFSDNPDFKDTWPAHCVAQTPGAKEHPAIDWWNYGRMFFKGQGKPAYSAFEGISLGDSLDDWLQENQVLNVDICGIAAEYCVRQTALDAVKRGYNTKVFGQEFVAALTPTGVQDVQAEIEKLSRV